MLKSARTTPPNALPPRDATPFMCDCGLYMHHHSQIRDAGACMHHSLSRPWLACAQVGHALHAVPGISAHTEQCIAAVGCHQRHPGPLHASHHTCTHMPRTCLSSTHTRHCAVCQCMM